MIMDFKFKEIPQEFELTEKIKQDNFLVNGKLVKWDGEFSPVYSTISSTLNISLLYLVKYQVWARMKLLRL
tara:strand:+ start:64 stop:276 length:213 start_codon:yes stop_codon:yes gene_type:complete